MTAETAARRQAPVRSLARACHPGPTVAVTLLALLLAVAAELTPSRGALVVAAVLCGQLSIGWANDLLDRDRDRRAGRGDKPVATGELPVPLVRTACAGALALCVLLSLLCGWAAAVVHLVCVAAGWTYDLGLKATPWSWVPYAVAFGGLTAFVPLAATAADLPPWWWPAGGALLGVAAHFLNALPDLDDDARTGVRGLPHRLGPGRIPVLAAATLLLASVVVVVGAEPPRLAALTAGAGVLALAALVVTGRGRVPFVAAIGIALVDVVLLVLTR